MSKILDVALAPFETGVADYIHCKREDVERIFAFIQGLSYIAGFGSRRTPEFESSSDIYADYVQKFHSTAASYHTNGATASTRFWNAVTALASEAAEMLNAPQDTKELGDFCWYLAMCYKIAGEDLFYLNLAFPSFPDSIRKIFSDSVIGPYGGCPAVQMMVIKTGLVLSYIKKTNEKAKPFDMDTVIGLLHECTRAFVYACLSLEVSPGAIMLENLDKLAKRHPNGFNPDYKSEGEAL